jgi:hypothetical protein
LQHEPQSAGRSSIAQCVGQRVPPVSEIQEFRRHPFVENFVANFVDLILFILDKVFDEVFDKVLEKAKRADSFRNRRARRKITLKICCSKTQSG